MDLDQSRRHDIIIVMFKFILIQIFILLTLYYYYALMSAVRHSALIPSPAITLLSSSDAFCP